MTPGETIYERWERDVGFGAEPKEKRFNPKEARDPHTGEWVKESGGSFADDFLHPSGTTIAEGPGPLGLEGAQKLQQRLEVGLKGTGIHSGAIGEQSTMREADVDAVAHAAKDVLKKFPELTQPPKKGWDGRRTIPFGGFEFVSLPEDRFGEAAVEHTRELSQNGILGAATSPDTFGDFAPGKEEVRTAINDSPMFRDGVHAMTGPDSNLSAEGRSGIYGELLHELGHAVAWSAGVHERDSVHMGDQDFRDLFKKHNLSQAGYEVSEYGAGSESEAFAELFANYMGDKMAPADRKNFEGLLTEILGRKV